VDDVQAVPEPTTILGTLAAAAVTATSLRQRKRKLVTAK
jgi:hypothetical protein